MIFFAEIAVDVPLRKTFTYAVPEALAERVKRGHRVLVPFGRKTLVGICVATHGQDFTKKTGLESSKIKEILAVDEAPLLDPKYLKWMEFSADYYLCPLGQALSQAIPTQFLNPKDFDLKKKARKSAVKIKSSEEVKTEPKKLTPAQQNIVTNLTKNIENFSASLIHGVTGSGKTEVYMALIENVLRLGKSALYLVPEIGLTPQTIARLSGHFSEKLRLYHSGCTVKERYETWKATQSGEPLVLVGTRSALFSPLTNLGIIIIDEEHDSSYKQEDRFRYHARDLAIVRAQMQNVPIILGSATPSLETYYQAKRGQYGYFELSERVGESVMPEMAIIDMASEKAQTKLPLSISQKMVQNLAKHFDGGEQAIVFVGQRGFAQNAFCTECHSIESCPNCSVGLKYHSHVSLLKCHYCDFHRGFDEICSSCKQKSLTLLGIGIQGVEAELRVQFPKANIARVDSDACPTPQKFNAILKDFAERKIDLIIGTQMMAKGHDFPGVGFVGVIGIDAHLGLPDFRAAERSFQTLVQVAGRAGRRQKQGKVLVQTYLPQHQSLVSGLKHDYQSFADLELAAREGLHYPPFTRLAQLRFIANHEKALVDFIKTHKKYFLALEQNLQKSGTKLLGPAEMPIYKLRGKFRYHLILKIPRTLKNREVLSYVWDDVEKRLPKNIQMQIDVDPVNLM